MKKTMFKLLCATALLTGASSAFAQTFVAPAAATGVVNGTNQTFTVTYNPVAGAEGFDFQLRSANANVTFVSASVAGTITANSLCQVPAAQMGLQVNCNAATTTPGTALGAGVITVTYNAGATAGPVALTFVAAGTITSDGGGNVTAATFANGQVTLNTGPSGPTLTYNPAAATAIVVPASISGTAVTTSIAVTSAGGDTGQSTTLACTVSGTGYVSTVTGSPFAGGVASSGTVGLGCAGTATAQTLTCTQTRSGMGGGAPVVSTWPLTCAAAPGFTSTPPDNGTLSIVGITGSTVTGAVSVSNPGTAALAISGCAVTGAGLTLGTVSASVASGGTGSIGVSCAVPPTAGATLTGTLQCNTTAAAPSDIINYTVNCLAQSASIPTLGFGGKALMVLLMLGFGLVGFQLYRRSA
jgi:hypothetical protein